MNSPGSDWRKVANGNAMNYLWTLPVVRQLAKLWSRSPRIIKACKFPLKDSPNLRMLFGKTFAAISRQIAGASPRRPNDKILTKMLTANPIYYPKH